MTPKNVFQKSGRALFLAAAATAISACVSTPNGPNQVYDYEARHPIVVQQSASTMRLSVPDGAYKMSGADEVRLQSFAYGYSRHGRGPVVVAVPKDTANAGAARAAATKIVRTLEGMGVAARSVQVSSYAPASGETPDVVLSYDRFVASAPGCGNWDYNQVTDHDNDYAPNFGCSTQHNLAAMVSNPLDLVRMRTPGPGDGARRDTVIELYRVGQATSASRTSSETASSQGN